jgi:RHS repeat-associated protein
MYYLADHLGSIAQETGSAGAVTLEREYDPWGVAIQGGATSGYAFTGREWDAETEFYYYRSRYYVAQSGQFLGADPVLSTGSLYSYVINSPLTHVDPSGNVPLFLLLPIVGGVISGGVGAISQASSGAQPADVGRGFLAGFASGFVGTAAAMGVAAISGVGGAVAGAVGGLVGSLTQGYVSGVPTSAIDAAVGTVTGAVGAMATALLPTKGRLPDLFTPRTSSNFGKNSQRLIGQEVISGAIGGGLGSAAGTATGTGAPRCNR